MKSFQARPASPEDAENYREWLQDGAAINLVDYDVFKYPCVNTITVDCDDKPILMNSFHPVLIMESLASPRGVDPKDAARAIRVLFESIRNVALATGIREIYFTCVDERVQKFAERKGWKRVNTPVFRMKVGGESDPLNHQRPVGRPPETTKTPMASKVEG